jgi:hypothetical protein
MSKKDNLKWNEGSIYIYIYLFFLIKNRETIFNSLKKKNQSYFK